MELELSDRQAELAVQPGILWQGLQAAARGENVAAEISLAVVEDGQMRELNDRFLARQETTDVLSFTYGTEGDTVEAEVVVNASEAIRQSADRTHSAHDELLLYVVHGFLHAVGYDDLEPGPAERMHGREQELLRSIGRPVQL